jgi:CRISPR-associated protein Csd2
MSTPLQNKIDFAVVLKVKNANPNGDPLNGNRPRTDYRNFGEISDVAIKRKIRNRLLDEGEAVFVQSDDRKNDDAGSLRERADANLDMKKKPDEIAKQACAKWFDVRAFGQLLAFKSKKKAGKKGEATESDEGDGGVSIGIRGPVSVQPAFSVEPIEVSSTQITKSVSGEGTGEKRGSDTMGMKHRVDAGVYTFFGSMNPQLAERTGFSDADAETIKKVLPKLFENDESSARPAGSMEVLKVYWWKHNSKAGQYSSAKVHATLKVNPDGSSYTDDLPGLKPEAIDGF